MVDLEDPAYKGKSMGQIEKVVWAKDVAALRSMGVNLSDDHMDGYLFKPRRKEENLDVKPWDASPLASIPAPPQVNTEETWDNPEFKFKIESGVAYMTINRPEANNAINGNVSAGLNDACHILETRRDVRVATLTGAGRMFCAGADPKAAVVGDQRPVRLGAPPAGEAIVSRGQGAKGNTKSSQEFAAMLYTVASLPQFTIACANGSVMAGGVGFICIVDMVIAVKQAYITLSEVKLGMIPATISPHVIGKIGPTHAKALFVTGENVKCAAAFEMGLVQHIVDSKEGFDPIIKDVCAKLQGMAPGALMANKKMMPRLMNGCISNSLIEFTVDEYTKSRKGAEAEGAMQGLIERKKPAWMEATIVPQDLLF